MRYLSLALLALVLFGCGQASDEAQAYKELQAKPTTEEQKKQMEAIISKAPANSEHAGIPTKP